MPAFSDRLKHAWNAFMNRDPPDYSKYVDYGSVSSNRPDRLRLTRGNERSIINAIYNRMAVDCAAITIQHVRLDDDNRFKEVIKSGLNSCLTVEANKDQTGRAFRQDIFMSLFDEGCIAVVPVDTDIDPVNTTSYSIESMRVGKILEWHPEHVKVHLYNDRTGKYEDIMCPKKTVAIIENPFYSVMNEPNSVLQRLIRKLNLLDAVDEQSSSGKLDLIIQLPYAIKTETRKAQAEQRRKDIEMQLMGTKYGIAYTDATEHITQLNRSVENNLLAQIEYLTKELMSQLGITTAILDGSASDQAMISYQNRTLEPCLSAVTDEFIRKFLTKTARSQGQSIMFVNDPFKLIPITVIATIADTFTRNEIMSSNEIRQKIGLKPVDDPQADQLRNKNLNPQDYSYPDAYDEEVPVEEEYEEIN